MTPDQMAELIARLRLRAKLFREAEPGSVIAGDMIRAADLIESMAQRVPLNAEQIKVAFDSDSNESYADFVSGVLFAEQAHGIGSEK